MILMAIPASNKLLVPQLINVSPKNNVEFFISFFADMLQNRYGRQGRSPASVFYRFRLSINLAIASIIAARANNSFVIALISLNRFLFLLISATSFLCFNYSRLSSFCQSFSIDYGKKITTSQLYSEQPLLLFIARIIGLLSNKKTSDAAVLFPLFALS